MKTQGRASQVSFLREIAWNPITASYSSPTTGSPTPSTQTQAHPVNDLQLRLMPNDIPCTNMRAREEADFQEAKRRSMEDITRGDTYMATRLPVDEMAACFASAMTFISEISRHRLPDTPTRSTIATSEESIAPLPIPTAHADGYCARPAPHVALSSNLAVADSSISQKSGGPNDHDEINAVVDRLTADLDISPAQKDNMLDRLMRHSTSDPLTLWRSKDGLGRGVVLDSAVDGSRRWQTWRDV